MKAYAKVNLLLKVINKKEDGYHNLQMINTKLDLYDNIYIKRNDTKIDTIKALNIGGYITSSENLILKVLKEFKNKYNIYVGYDIAIEKNIPFSSGLGGVSMDVAQVLKYVIKDNNIIISNNELINFTKQYGADIPYGFIDGAAIVEGIGDIITKINLKKEEYILIMPNIEISTPYIFSHHKYFSKACSYEELISLVNTNNRSNDLEKTARYIYKELDELIIELEQYGKVVMSGSGPSLLLKPFNDIDNTLNILIDKYKDIKIIKVKTKEG